MRRLFWFGLGVGTSIWSRRKARQAAQRYLPEEVKDRVERSARSMADSVRDALDDGRRTYRFEEQELRRDLGASPPRPRPVEPARHRETRPRPRR